MVWCFRCIELFGILVSSADPWGGSSGHGIQLQTSGGSRAHSHCTSEREAWVVGEEGAVPAPLFQTLENVQNKAPPGSRGWMLLPFLQLLMRGLLSQGLSVPHFYPCPGIQAQFLSGLTILVMVSAC